MSMKKLKKLILEHRDYIIIYVTPLVLLPLPFLVYETDPETDTKNYDKSLCGFILLLMGTYWCTNALPLPITGCIPIFMAPMFKLLTYSQVCANYLEDNTMMMTGGLFVAVALEMSELHRRLALFILKTVGTQPGWLMFGFMLPTWFLSMWISNTATTSMMLPILEAVLEQLGEMKEFQVDEDQANALANIQFGSGNKSPNITPKKATNSIQLRCFNKTDQQFDPGQDFGTGDVHENHAFEFDDMEDTAIDNEKPEIDMQNEDLEKASKSQPTKPKRPGTHYYNELCKGMTMSVAYAANVGGTATLTGTPPNVIMKEHADDIWQKNGYDESPVTYASWMVYGFPQACINFIFVYIWMRVFYLGWRSFKCEDRVETEDAKEKKDAVKRVILNEYNRLGSLRYAEVMSGLAFVLLVTLWFFRSPGFIEGWGAYFGQDANGDPYIGDVVPAMLMAVVLFCIPSYIPGKYKAKPDDAGKSMSKKAPALLDWNQINSKYPWSIIFLMGGGFALADACEVSGLSQWIGEQFTVLGDLHPWLMVAIICLITAFLTEVTSNSATCTILMPIVAVMAEELEKNPLYLMMPVCISTSFAFMLPVATPPNAIAFSYGRITVWDMVKAGALLNFLCVFTVDMATHTWAYAFFDYDTIPWASNATTETFRLS